MYEVSLSPSHTSPTKKKKKKRDAVSAWIQVPKNILLGNKKISNSLLHERVHALILMPRHREPCSSSIFTSWKQTISMATPSIQVRSFLSVFFALLVMHRRKLSMSETFTSRTLIHFSGDRDFMSSVSHTSVNMHKSHVHEKKKKASPKLACQRFSVWNSCTDFSSDVVFLPFVVSPCLYILLPFLPFLRSCLSLVRRPLALTCQGPFDVGSLCQCPLSRTDARQVLVRLAICQGNHFQEMTVKCWCVFPHGRNLNRLPEALHLRQLCTAQRLSPRKQRCHQGRVSSSLFVSFHLAFVLRIPLKSATVRFPPLPYTLFLEHSPCLKPQSRRTSETREKTLCLHTMC